MPNWWYPWKFYKGLGAVGLSRPKKIAYSPSMCLCLHGVGVSLSIKLAFVFLGFPGCHVLSFNGSCLI